MNGKWYKWAECQECKFRTRNFTLGDLFFFHFHVCPKCGASHSKFVVKTMRRVWAWWNPLSWKWEERK